MSDGAGDWTPWTHMPHPTNPFAYVHAYVSDVYHRVSAIDFWMLRVLEINGS